MCKFYIILFSLCLLVACTSTPTTVPPIVTVSDSVLSGENTPSLTQKDQLDGRKPCGDPNLTCIGFMTDVDQLNEGTFYQAVWNGIKRAEFDLAATVLYAESNSIDEHNLQFQQFAESEFDIVVTAGHGLLVPTLEASKKYPNLKFIGIDQEQFLVSENLTNVVFPQEKAGFLAGVLAGSITQTKVVGAIFGTVRSPTYPSYRRGFEAGVSAIDSSIKVIVLYHPGDITNGQSDPEWGANAAQFMLNNQADVIFAAGGQTAAGALVEVAQSSSAYCIGAEIDQFEYLPNARSCLVSSAVRDIEQEVFISVARAVIDDQAVGILDGSFHLAPFHRYDKYFTADIKLFFRTLEEGLASNRIPTNGKYKISKPPQISLP